MCRIPTMSVEAAHAKTTYDLPEHDQQLRPIHFEPLINK